MTEISFWPNPNVISLSSVRSLVFIETFGSSWCRLHRPKDSFGGATFYTAPGGAEKYFVYCTINT